MDQGFELHWEGRWQHSCQTCPGNASVEIEYGSWTLNIRNDLGELGVLIVFCPFCGKELPSEPTNGTQG